MNKRSLLAPFVGAVTALSLTFAIRVVAAPAPLQPGSPIEVSSAPKRFDLMVVDGPQRRLLAAHSQAGTLTIVDLVHHNLERTMPVGESSGVAIDPQDDKYFVGTTHGVAVVNRHSLKKTGFIATPGPDDAMVFDPYNDRLYVGHDDDHELWVIDPRADKIAGHIAIPASPELMAVDPRSHRLYLNIKPRNEVVTIVPYQARIVAHWSTLPTRSPHGLALDLRDGRLFVAGHSRTVSEFSLPSGKRLKDIDIGPGHVDQIAFDSDLGRLYCPSSGRLVTVEVGAGRTRVLGSAAIPRGTHSVAVDPHTHKVWIAFATKHHSYVQAFAPVTDKAGSSRAQP